MGGGGGGCLKKILLLHMIKCGLVDRGAQKVILRASGSLHQSKEVLVEMDREVVFLHYNHQVFLHWMQLCTCAWWWIGSSMSIRDCIILLTLFCSLNSSGLLSSNSGSLLDCPDSESKSKWSKWKPKSSIWHLTPWESDNASKNSSSESESESLSGGGSAMTTTTLPLPSMLLLVLPPLLPPSPTPLPLPPPLLMPPPTPMTWPLPPLLLPLPWLLPPHCHCSCCCHHCHYYWHCQHSCCHPREEKNIHEQLLQIVGSFTKGSKGQVHVW